MKKYNTVHKSSSKASINTDPAAQRRLALWAVEHLRDDKAPRVLITLYRARPRVVPGAQTRLLGQRGPTGTITDGGPQFIRAKFNRKRLIAWAESWLVAHGVVDTEPLPHEVEAVTEWLSKYGLPVHLHKYLTEEVTGG